MTIRYVEIVTPLVDETRATYEKLHGLTFAARDPGLGQAVVARLPTCQLGIRAPMTDEEQPTVRLYLLVEDVEAAARAAAQSGAMIALPPTELQGGHGSIAIFIQGGIEHGLWQDPAHP